MQPCIYAETQMFTSLFYTISRDNGGHVIVTKGALATTVSESLSWLWGKHSEMRTIRNQNKYKVYQDILIFMSDMLLLLDTVVDGCVFRQRNIMYKG